MHEVLLLPQGLPFPHHWRHEMFDRAGGQREDWKEVVVEGRRSWHRVSAALFVVVKTKDVIFGLLLVQHTLQTVSHNT